MIHVDFNKDQLVCENKPTFDYLCDVCDSKIIVRTFSGWRHLSSVRDIMQMLGYTVRSAGNIGYHSQYKVISWYGEYEDRDDAVHIVESLCDLYCDAT